MDTQNLSIAYFSSPIGWLELTGSSAGIRSVLFMESVPTVSVSVPVVLEECIGQFEDYFNGKLKQFTVPLDMEGSEFQVRTWKNLISIPYGKTISYKQLAVKTGDSMAVRAVGHANGQNRINIIVPCHRVIGTDGKLTGYGGGLWRKEWLLKFEKANEPEGLFAINKVL
jgi:methylated-DNA-[protein]-cysteine S-methyltransferase